MESAKGELISHSAFCVAFIHVSSESLHCEIKGLSALLN